MNFEVKYEISRGRALRKLYLRSASLPAVVLSLFAILFLIEAIWNSQMNIFEAGSGARNLRLVIIGMVVFPVITTLYWRTKTLRAFRAGSILHVTLRFNDQSFQVLSEHGSAIYFWSFIFDVKRRISHFVLRGISGDIEIPKGALTAEQWSLIQQRVMIEP